MTPLNELKLEQGVYELLAEWLPTYFDGGSHAVGGNAAVTFPNAALGFAQSNLPQPLMPVTATDTKAPLVGLTVVLGKALGAPSRRWEIFPKVGGSRQLMVYKKVRLNFWIRSATADNADRLLCMNAGARLEGLLGNASATRPLAQNGMHRLRPASVEPVADTTFMLRLLPCEVTLKYAVRLT